MASQEEFVVKRALDRVVVIPGAMKSGTTTLFAYLAQHPQACVPSGGEKEVNFFSTDAYTGGLEAYQSRFEPDENHVFYLDASPNYTKYPSGPDTPALMAQLPLDFRFIYVMRNPVDRIESHLAHNAARGRFGSSHFVSPERLRTPIIASSYSTQLDRFVAAFPDIDERMLMLDFRELIDQPERTMEMVERFLGLPKLDYQPVGRQNRRLVRHGSHLVLIDSETQGKLWTQLLPEMRALRDVHGFAPADRWIVQAESFSPPSW